MLGNKGLGVALMVMVKFYGAAIKQQIIPEDCKKQLTHDIYNENPNTILEEWIDLQQSDGRLNSIEESYIFDSVASNLSHINNNSSYPVFKSLKKYGFELEANFPYMDLSSVSRLLLTHNELLHRVIVPSLIDTGSPVLAELVADHILKAGYLSYYNITQGGAYFRPATSDIKGTYVFIIGHDHNKSFLKTNHFPSQFLKLGYEIIVFHSDFHKLPHFGRIEKPVSDIKGIAILAHGGSEEKKHIITLIPKHSHDTAKVLEHTKNIFGDKFADKIEVAILSCHSGVLSSIELKNIMPKLDKYYTDTTGEYNSQGWSDFYSVFDDHISGAFDNTTSLTHIIKYYQVIEENKNPELHPPFNYEENIT